jgi:hypothetical protein
VKRSIGKIKGDDSGYGYLELSDEFMADTPVYRLDVLQDILRQLIVAHAKAFIEVYPGLGDDCIREALGHDRPN